MRDGVHFSHSASGVTSFVAHSATEFRGDKSPSLLPQPLEYDLAPWMLYCKHLHALHQLIHMHVPLLDTRCGCRAA